MLCTPPIMSSFSPLEFRQERGNDFLIGRACSAPHLPLLLPFPFLSPFPPVPSISLSPSLPYPLEVGPHIAARRSGGALELPQRVRAKPGRQTVSGAF